MNKKWIVSGIFLSLSILTDIWAGSSESYQDKRRRGVPAPKENAYFFPIDVSRFSSSNLPLVEIEIEKKIFQVILSTGNGIQAELFEKGIEQIQDKAFVSCEMACGLRGEEYPENVYRIPRLKMGGAAFFNVSLIKGAEELYEEGLALSADFLSSERPDGVIGWKLFSSTNLFLDLANDQIAICDSFETFLQQGHRAEEFIRRPLITDDRLPAIDAITDQGRLRCLLCSEMSFDFINVENEENLPMEVVARDPKNVMEFEFVRIGGLDLGKRKFRHLPIEMPLPIEAILGIDFFRNHRIFIDFKKDRVYLAPAKKAIENVEDRAKE